MVKKYVGKEFLYSPGKFPAEQIELFDLVDLAYHICHELIRRGIQADFNITYPSGCNVPNVCERETIKKIK